MAEIYNDLNYQLNMSKFYIKEYSEDDKSCQYTNCLNLGTWHRQNTQYVDDIRNWVCYCPEHRKENDEHWKEMWQDLYNGYL